ncbi:MAG: hypothetical protein Q7J73_03375 [Dehalococcoidales bacterium]|nr:hypothetical protein [Dehalococcoidales bacterium]
MAGPHQPQRCSIKQITSFGIVFSLSTLIALTSCVTVNQTKVTLITGGYGYEIGDIVLLDTKKEPEPGDIVQYDWGLNKSNCMGMGPSASLAKIIGLPGDKVSFNVSSFSANGYTGFFPYGPGISPRTKPTMWGTIPYADATNMELVVPDGEYLADRWIGLECTGEMDETHSSKTYNRFTIKQQAIEGVILKKLGHDQAFQDEQKKIIY